MKGLDTTPQRSAMHNSDNSEYLSKQAVKERGRECRYCYGSGRVWDTSGRTDPCPKCYGTGEGR